MQLVQRASRPDPGADLWWRPEAEPPAFSASDLLTATRRFRAPAFILRDPDSGRIGVGLAGGAGSSRSAASGQISDGAWPAIGMLPPLYPEWLGDRSFLEAHGVRFPYVAGAMANGIASERLVIAMAEAGFLAFFGAAGLSPARVEKAIDTIDAALAQRASSWGANLIHSPNEPSIEAAVADLYLRRGVRRVEASAYMGLTPPIVRYALSGLERDGQGRIHRRNMVFAKISRPEVARRFLEPAPSELIEALVRSGQVTAEEAALAREIPLAEDITVESDSGGHTDNRPLGALFPTIQLLRDQIVAERGYRRPIRVGAAGGLGTPGAVAAAFSHGAAFVLTGSVNQSCIESGLHDSGKAMLAAADVADVIMAPAADMFELGVDVQVLRRGTLFAQRARKLRQLYESHASLDEIGDADRAVLERDILRASIAEAWKATESFWRERDPTEADRAGRDPKHRMALVFRSYLGLSSKWSIAGVDDRRMDYQIWCGPAMGAFNAWTRGTFLAEPANRKVVQVALNLMEGAASLARAHQLRSFGVPIPAAAFDFRPRPLQ